ncbi:hypothetical protein [Streptomyces sp. NPDC048172]|uniref:hypothetical protein n=1 Tax=Streptomyces sp. NPDC048172 TaxID=3365505 RepID=UPI00371653DD
MSTRNPQGLALFLVLAGILLAFTGLAGAVAVRDNRLMLIASVGFALQVAGWRRAARAGGAA